MKKIIKKIIVGIIAIILFVSILLIIDIIKNENSCCSCPGKEQYEVCCRCRGTIIKLYD